MPLTNVTADDVSALVQYTGVGSVPWTDSPTKDPTLGSYWDGTYHSSILYGASAEFLFDGVAVYYYASKRSQHGAFGIYLDGQYVYNNNGYSLNPVFKQLMYSVDNLTPGPHNLTIINTDTTNKTYTEVDYITWTTSMDPSLTESLGTAIPHGSTDMKYSSTAAWSEEQDSDPTMVTSTDGASVTINFSGNGIVLNGKRGIVYGMFRVQVDNDTPRELSASSQQTHSTILYRRDNLKPGNHILTVTNLGGGFTSLSIGSAVPIIWSADPNAGSSNSNSGSGSSHSVNAGALAGGIAGGVIGLAAIVLFILWFIRRGRSRRDAQADEIERQRPQSGFAQTTPFVMPYAPQTPTHSFDGRKTDTQSQYLSAAYGGGPNSPGLISPGLTSHGSFDFGGQRPGMVGAESFSAGSSSGRGGPASEAGRSAGPGKPGRYQGSINRTEMDAESMRDRQVLLFLDAGPVLLPQLPPAYSDTRPALPPGAAAPSSPNSRNLLTPAPSQNPPTPDPSLRKMRPGDTNEQR